MLIACVQAQISYLPPGIHTFAAKDVQVINTYDILIIHTGMKPFQDQMTLQKEVTKFKHECSQMNKTLQDYCSYWETLIDAEIIQFKSLINQQSQKSKRSLSLVAPLIRVRVRIKLIE